MVYTSSLVRRVQDLGKDRLRSLKMAIMDNSLVNPRDVYPCPVAGMLTVTGPPVTPRLVKGKAFQEVVGRGQPCSSTLS